MQLYKGVNKNNYENDNFSKKGQIPKNCRRRTYLTLRIQPKASWQGNRKRNILINGKKTSDRFSLKIVSGYSVEQK